MMFMSAKDGSKNHTVQYVKTKKPRRRNKNYCFAFLLGKNERNIYNV